MTVTRNPNLGPSSIRARKRKQFLTRAYVVTFFLAVVVFSLAIYSGNEKVIVKEINISNNAAVPSNDILAIVDRDMAGRYGYLFSRNNFFIFPRFQIKADILNEIKTVKDVKVSWDGWQKISIVVQEREPHSVWCGNEQDITDQKCFFVDDGGYIYSEASTFSGNLFIRGYGVLDLIDDTGTSTEVVDPIGKNYLPTEIYTGLFKFITLLENRNLRVNILSYTGIDFQLTLETGPVIIFNFKNDSTDKPGVSLAFVNFFAALDGKNLDLLNDVSLIDYIDLRFENKVVVGKKVEQTNDEELIKP